MTKKQFLIQMGWIMLTIIAYQIIFDLVHLLLSFNLSCIIGSVVAFGILLIVKYKFKWNLNAFNITKVNLVQGVIAGYIFGLIVPFIYLPRALGYAENVLSIVPPIKIITLPLVVFFKQSSIYLVFAVVCEELIYRGAMLSTFKNYFKNTHLAVILTSVLFACLHVGLLLTFDYEKLSTLFIWGLFLGYGVKYFKNITFSIFAHYSLNAVTLIMPALLKKYM
jgi:membrane protease YdiL (CAAX protease family)